MFKLAIFISYWINFINPKLDVVSCRVGFLRENSPTTISQSPLQFFFYFVKNHLTSRPLKSAKNAYIVACLRVICIHALSHHHNKLIIMSSLWRVIIIKKSFGFNRLDPFHFEPLRTLLWKINHDIHSHIELVYESSSLPLGISRFDVFCGIA